jgi:hypothetical protein
MRVTRLVLVTAVAIAVAAVVASVASAVRFADQPCPEAGPGGIRVCPTAVVGSWYEVKLNGDGGCGPDPNVPGSGLPYQFRLLSGTPPPGLSLQKDGTLSGNPDHAGAWAFWVELSDQDPPSASWCVPKKSERQFLVQVMPPIAMVGRPYSVPAGAAGEGAQTWAVSSGVLPPGLSLDAGTGFISGIATSAGSFGFRLTAVDSKGHTALVDLAIVVHPIFSIATTHLAPASVGRSYAAKVRTRGAVGPVLLKVSSGRFPVGVRLNQRTGAITGRPRKAGSFHLRIEATDSTGETTSRTLVLTVRRSSA